MVKKDNFSKICSCSGSYDYQIDEISNPLVHNYLALLKNLKKVAKKCNFKLLNVTSDS